MDANEPGLFDLPDVPQTAAPERRLRGRNRETWVRTATAEVAIIDAAALREASALVRESTVTIGFPIDPVEDSDFAAPDEARIDDDPLDALAWLIWPPHGMEKLLEANAFRILSVNSRVDAEGSDRGRITWTVTAKLTDVEALRRAATEAHPEAAGLITESLEVAWGHAADPFAPMRSIPGTTWRPRQVTVQHLHARAARDQSRGR